MSSLKREDSVRVAGGSCTDRDLVSNGRKEGRKGFSWELLQRDYIRRELWFWILASKR